MSFGLRQLDETFGYALASPNTKAVAGLERKAEQRGMSLANAALTFAQSHLQTTSLFFGTSKLNSHKRNLRALSTETPSKFTEPFA